jgi:hypothetical protein
MYCPQCGGADEDSAKFCSTCGLDLDKYKRQWQDPDVPGTGQPAERSTGDESDQQQAVYQQPGAQSPPDQQPYQQQYQGEYAPPYQTPQSWQTSQYYQSTPPYGTVPRVPSYMGWAIATLILCFWPTGIVAVVYASQVGNKLSVGDIAGAQESSRKAKTWCWVTFAIGVAGVVIAIIATLLLAAAAVTV